MCNFGGGNDTTVANTEQKNKPTGLPTMKGIVQRANTVSQLPYTPITQGVAGFTPEQNLAMGNVNQAFGQSLPYMTSAANMFQDASSPLTAADISQYYNPMAANVMAGMSDIFGQQMKQTTGDLTAAAGGVGADRIGVGQSEIARQQGLAAGQTLASLYQNALQARQNQQGIEQASAFGLGNLGTAQEQAALAGAGAQFNVGSAEQNTEQMVKNAAFNQQMAQAAYPFQTAQWYSGIAAPVAGMEGGKTTGTQTVNPPNPNGLSQVAGLGIAALGAFANRGGGIKGYAMGGSPYPAPMFGGDASSYVPTVPLPGMQAQPQPPLGFLPAPSATSGVGGKGSNVGRADVQAGKGLDSIYNYFTGATDNDPMSWATSVSPSGLSGWSNYLSNMFSQAGGRVEDNEPYKILTGIARGKGGKVKGYASGGSPIDDAWDTPIAYDDTDMAPSGGGIIENSLGAPITYGGTAPKIHDRLTPEVAPAPLPPKMQDRLSPEPETKLPSKLPAGIDYMPGNSTAPGESPTFLTPPAGAPYAPPLKGGVHDDNVNPGPIHTTPTPGEQTGPHETGQPMDITPHPVSPNPGGPWSNAVAGAYGDYLQPGYNARPTLFGRPLTNGRLAMMAAGLGMMGGTSPYFATNVGQGGLQGINTLKEFQQLDAQRQAQALQNMMEAGRLDVANKQLAFNSNDKLIDDYRQLSQYYDGIGDKDRAEFFAKKASALAQSVYGGAGAAPAGGAGTADITAPPAEPPSAGSPAKVSPTEAVPIVPKTHFGRNIQVPDNVTYGYLPKDARTMAKTETNEMVKASDAAFQSANLGAFRVADMQGHFADMDKTGFLTQGPGAESRVAIAKWINTTYQVLQGEESLRGLTPDKLPFDPEKIADFEALTKDTTQLGFELARTLGTREAMQVIMSAKAAVPGLENTPLGARIVLASIQAMQQREQDRHKFLSDWRAKYTYLTGADDAFNKARSPDFYFKRAMQIAHAQNSVYTGAMSQDFASKALTKMGIDPSEAGFNG